MSVEAYLKFFGGVQLSKEGMTTRRGSRRADWVDRESMGHVLAALTSPNRLAIEVAMATRLRISDVLSIKTDQLMRHSGAKAAPMRITVRQLKTSKPVRVYIPLELRGRMLAIAGRRYVFEGRMDWRKHRTRQAVAKDMERARKILRVPRLVVSAHTARKIWAVEQMHRTGDLSRVQRDLGHTDPAITAVYAMADTLTRRKLGRK